MKKHEKIEDQERSKYQNHFVVVYKDNQMIIDYIELIKNKYFNHYNDRSNMIYTQEMVYNSLDEAINSLKNYKNTVVQTQNVVDYLNRNDSMKLKGIDKETMIKKVSDILCNYNNDNEERKKEIRKEILYCFEHEMVEELIDRLKEIRDENKIRVEEKYISKVGKTIDELIEYVEALEKELKEQKEDQEDEDEDERE